MKKILYTIMLLLVSGVVYAQSADVVTDILNSPEVTFGQVCYLSAVNQGLIDDSAGYEEGIRALYIENQIPEEVYTTTPVAMVDLAYIYSRIWEVKGGFLYRITGGSPRYAFKQLKADGVIPETSAPSDIVSGPEALNILTSCMFEYGGMTLDDIGDEEE